MYISFASLTSVKNISLYLSGFRIQTEIDSGITKRKILLGTNTQEKWHTLGLKMELIYSPAPLAAKQKWVEKIRSDNSDESCIWAGTKAVFKMCSQFSDTVTIFWERSGFLTLGLRLKKKKNYISSAHYSLAFCILLLGFVCQQQNQIRWVTIPIKSLIPALQMEDSKTPGLEGTLGALAKVGFVLVLGVQRPELRLGSVLWLLELSLCLEIWGKWTPVSLAVSSSAVLACSK